MSITRLGQSLVHERILSPQQYDEIVREAKSRRMRLIRMLFEDSNIDERRLLNFLSKHFRIPVAELSNFQMPEHLVKILDSKFCNRHGVLPLSHKGDTLVVASSDPTDVRALDEIRFRTRKKVEFVLAPPTVIGPLIDRFLGTAVDRLVDNFNVNDRELDDVELVDEQEMDEGHNEVGDKDDAPIINYVSALMIDAIKKRGSDIHIEPYENDLRVRYRIDGKLVNASRPPPRVKSALVARVKVMANMRLDEKRLPQDGRILFRLSGGRAVDFRVNTLPTVYGEKVVMRILDKSAGVAKLDALGFEPADLERFKGAIRSPWGICLVTGPTGSGKTSTLYAALNFMNNEQVNISTIEEPVEYNFRGINQVNIKEAIGLTFPSTLRALLRQDPDIILLGEIRDADTAKTAMQAALTGHMVLSTIHTNDAPSTIARLQDMNVETFLINSSLQVIVAQRLVRRLCTHCKTVDTRFTPNQLEKMGFAVATLNRFRPQRGEGCHRCNKTGYHGRVAVFEVLFMSEKMRQAVAALKTADELRTLAVEEGMVTLKQNTIKKVLLGQTSIDELQSISMTTGE